MTFNEILEKLLYGKKVRRSTWHPNLWMESNGDSVYLRTNTDKKVINAAHYSNDDRVFTLEDVTADDWEVMK